MKLIALGLALVLAGCAPTTVEEMKSSYDRKLVTV